MAYVTGISWRAYRQGALVHQDHRYEGVWRDDLPDGPGCYVFGASLVQEGVYTVRQQPAEEEEAVRSGEEDEPTTLVPVWRAHRSVLTHTPTSALLALRALCAGRQLQPQSRPGNRACVHSLSVTAF